jgi:D-proline reductase (dithiol) PrdB
MSGIVDPAHRIFVSYIDKSREFYLAHDYGNPYRWAHHDDSPFTPLKKPLAESRLGLVTTASVITWDAASEPDPMFVPRDTFAAPTDPAPTALYTEHRAWDKEATHTRDVDSFAPINRLREAAERGRIGSLSPRFYGIPTEYSQRKTHAIDVPRLIDFCREDGVDVAMLVALCPVCHQTTSLAARHLEEAGIPTVLLGSARDIVEQVAVPRFLFTDFPLGNPCGVPYDVAMQTAIVGMGLDLLESARFPRTTVQTPFRWHTDDWRENFMHVGDDNREALRQAGIERRERQAERKARDAAAVPA